MDDDHCVITTQHRICEIPIAANKRQFSVFVNMSAAWVLPNDDANIKKRNLNLQEKKNFVLLQRQKCRYSLCHYALHYKRFQIGLHPLSVKPVCFYVFRRKSFNKLRNYIPILYAKTTKFIPSEFALKFRP